MERLNVDDTVREEKEKVPISKYNKILYSLKATIIIEICLLIALVIIILFLVDVLPIKSSKTQKYKIGFIAAMSQELDALIKEFPENTIKVSNETHSGKEFKIIEYKNKVLISLISGVGKVNAAWGTTVLIETYSPNLIINVGIAGGLLEEQKPLDLVIARDFLYHDVDIIALKLPYGKLLFDPIKFNATEKLVKMIKDMEAKGNFSDIGGKFFYGTIGSGDQFIANDNNEKINFIKSNFPEVLCVEMEGASIAHVCSKYNIDFLSIRSLSDVAVIEDHPSADDFNKNVLIASEQAAKLSKEIIDSI